MFMDFPSTFKFVTQASELGCGFLLLGYYSRLFNLLGLALIFFFCLRFLRSPLHRSDKSIDDKSIDDKSRDENYREESLEDQVFDVASLRRLVKAERQRYNAACAEIEKEQGAAASAAEEAMAMILRLQSEKSAVEIQAKQFRRVVEQRQEYDQEVMESLRWTVVQVESQKNLLERQLGVYRDRLRQFLDDQEAAAAEIEAEIDQLQEQQEQQEEQQQQEQQKEEEQEQEEAAATPSVSDDADSSSGFLNFSVEIDDVNAVSASSQNHSPPHSPTQQHL